MLCKLKNKAAPVSNSTELRPSSLAGPCTHGRPFPSVSTRFWGYIEGSLRQQVDPLISLICWMKGLHRQLLEPCWMKVERVLHAKVLNYARN